MDKKLWLKIGIAGAVILFLIWVFRFSPIADRLNLGALQGFLQGLGMWGPLIYILLYSVLTVLFFPASVLTAAGGLAFGLFWGTLYAVIGATIAATIAFVIARKAARGFVEKHAGETFKRWDRKLAHNGFTTVAIMRLLFLPYIPVSYAAGASRVTLGAFALATFLTNIPGGFAFAFLGDSLTENPLRVVFAIIVIILVLLSPQLFKRLLGRSHKI